jgi:voltage-gated potassium channel Kch
LFLTALSICFVFGGIAHLFGFSIAIGSFLGGLAVASFPYNIEIISRVHSLRDFFSTIFFVSLGMGIGISFDASLLLPIIILLILILLVKPFFMMLMTSAFGYSTRTSFLTAISLTQISEFSLIMVIQGLRVGHIGQDVFSLTVFLTLVTITLTSYLIKFDDLLYRRLSGYLTPFERLCHVKNKAICHSEQSESKLGGRRKSVVVCGCHRMGYSIVKALREMDKEILVIEFDPDIIEGLSREGVPCMYGDIGDVEVLRRARLDDADVVISTIPRLEDNLLLIDMAKKINSKILVIATASTLDHAEELYHNGADYVILPKWLAGEKAAEFMVLYMKNPHSIEHTKREHLRHIERIRQEEFTGESQPHFIVLIEGIKKYLKRNYEED